MKDHETSAGDLCNLRNDRAIAWAREHSAETIIHDDRGSELSLAVRASLRDCIVEAVTLGWSAQTLARELRDSYAFSRDRAVTIARTELAMAYSQGAMQGYITSGVVKGKRWLLDADQCPICRANAEQGEIPLLQVFSSGHMTSPAHDSCRCCVVPIVD